MNRKPQVFIDGRDTTEHLFQERYNHLYEMGKIRDFKKFVEKEGILIDGDIFLGISENRLYYKKEFIISCKDGEFFEYINFVSIPKNISESFDNLIDVFGNAAIVCSKLDIELRLEFHKSDKTFLEIAQEFGSNKIQYVGIIDNQLVVELKSFSQKLKVSINHENKIEYLKKIYQLSLEPRISIFFLYSDEFLRKTDNDFEESEKSIIENINFLEENKVNKVYIDNKTINLKRFDVFIHCLTGPQSVIERKIATFNKDIKRTFEILQKTQPGSIIINERRLWTKYQNNYTYITKKCEYYDNQSIYKYELIKDICIAFASLQLPPYVLLEIVDWLPSITFEKHIRKINLINSMRNSIRNVINNRGNEKNIKIK